MHNLLVRKCFKFPKILRYSSVRRCLEDFPLTKDSDCYPLANADWDNTPRAKHLGSVFWGATPSAFKAHLLKCFEQLVLRDTEKQILFIRAWNEWAEGNCLEPESKYGYGYLEAIRDVKQSFQK